MKPVRPTLPALNAAQQCHLYREVGLDATADSNERVWMHIGHAASAVSMPDVLGRHVQDGLLKCGIRSPIVNWPRCFRWTILTLPPDRPTPHDTSEVLLRVFAHVHSPGTAIALPAPTSEEIFYRTWVTAPGGGDLPDMQTVLNATILAAQRYRR